MPGGTPEEISDGTSGKTLHETFGEIADVTLQIFHMILLEKISDRSPCEILGRTAGGIRAEGASCELNGKKIYRTYEDILDVVLDKP